MPTLRPMQQLDMTRYRLDLGWAGDLVGGEIFAQNKHYAPQAGIKESLRLFDYRRSLGGLAVLCSQRAFSFDAIGDLASRRRERIINLADGVEPVILTSTRFLAAAFIEMTEINPDSEITHLGFEGPVKKLRREGNDTWAIPLGATILLGGQVESAKLPHQLVEVG